MNVYTNPEYACIVRLSGSGSRAAAVLSELGFKSTWAQAAEAKRAEKRARLDAFVAARKEAIAKRNAEIFS